MNYLQLAYLHLATVLPAFLIGSFLLFRRKGTPNHRALGHVYMALMLATATVALFMPAMIGPTILHHFGFIHLLCALTIYAVAEAYFAVRRGDIKTHRRAMVRPYVGALLIAGAFTLTPVRLLNDWLFGVAA
jgi:uncharacterized membrane protein